MASRLYSSTDVGAPQLAGTTKNALNMILKAVLVDGYGDKSPLGWDLIYQDADAGICVFRPRVGSRMFLQVVDDGISEYNGRIARVRSFESMQSTVLGQGPSPDYPVGNYILKTVYANTVSQRWNIIGDERGFYLIIFPLSTDTSANMKRNRSIPYYYGEYNTISGTSSTNNYNWITTANINRDEYIAIRKDVLQFHAIRNPFSSIRGSEQLLWNTYDFIETENFNKIGCRGYSQYCTIYDNKMQYNPVRLSLSNGTYRTYALGTLPGFLFPAFASKVFPEVGVIEDAIDENNKIILYPTVTNVNSSYYITYDVNKGAADFPDALYGIILGDKFRNVY